MLRELQVIHGQHIINTEILVITPVSTGFLSNVNVNRFTKTADDFVGWIRHGALDRELGLTIGLEEFFLGITNWRDQDAMKKKCQPLLLTFI